MAIGLLGSQTPSQGFAAGLSNMQALEPEMRKRREAEAMKKAISAPGGIFGGLSEGDKALLSANPNIANSVMASTLSKKLSPQAGPAKTAAMRNAEYMAQLKPDDPRLKFMMKPASQVNITNVGEKEEAKKMGGYRVKQFEKGDTEKQTAIGNLVEYQVLEQASQDPELHQGVLGGASLGIKRVMKEVFGADVGGTTSGEIIQKANTRLIQEAIKVQGRGFSDADLKFSQKAQPGILDSKEAFTISIGMAKRAEQFKILKQNFREDFYNQNGTLKGVNKELRRIENKYIKETKSDLRKLREMSGSIKQTLPTAGAGRVIQQFKNKFKGLE